MNEDFRMADKVTPQDAIEQCAAERLITRLHDPDWNDQKQADLDAWFSESVAHEVAYLRLEAGWNQADKLSILRKPLQPPARPLRQPQGANKLHIAAVLLLCAAIGGGIYAATQPPEGQIFATPIGGRETITLADGSQIELNTNSEIRLPRGARQAVLIRGEAYFHIKHDPQHPFTLDAGKHRIVDLGTKFVVRQNANDLEVTLVEGRARVESASGGANPKSAVLNPGDVAIATRDDLTVMRKPLTALSDSLSWRSGFVVFHHTTLREAADELNRYNVGKIVIADANVGERVFGGKFRTTDSERFANVVGMALGLTVERRGSEIVISGK
ncbi:MAG TPA: FecR domain-containing protein [Rhizomicrobium sp.]|nr:FecR domain-containing protein [Rhizomicrobium sp.]